ncbi:hypothetical protein EDC01DRAFT_634694 [Geopyxis carbonaria]|nr:hypothetical protein EDC01DRAFT_634694 [Geopyxis carbonaria]
MILRTSTPPLALLTLALTLTLAHAAIDIPACCTRVPVTSDLAPHLWAACTAVYNASDTHPLTRFSPPILAPLSWCRTNCAPLPTPLSISDPSQWLGPLTGWVLPAASMLFLIPIREHLPAHRATRALPRWRRALDETVLNWLDPARGYLHLLGDPVSAFAGALAQMATDLHLCAALQRAAQPARARTLLAVALLAGQCTLDTPAVRATFQLLAVCDAARTHAHAAARTMFAARRKFNVTVTLPVAAYIGCAVVLFRDAAEKLGDPDTAHALAYGVWLAWIPVLGVCGNAVATHVSLEAVRSGLECILRNAAESGAAAAKDTWDRAAGPPTPLFEFAATALATTPPPPAPGAQSYFPDIEAHPVARDGRIYTGSIELAATPLHARYATSLAWEKYLFDRGVDVDPPAWAPRVLWPDHWTRRSWPRARYAAVQLAAWAAVAFPCACAAWLSWCTPPVGAGCRSANHALYAALSLLVALLRVPLEVSPDKTRRWVRRVLAGLYDALTGVNVLVLLLGTLAQFTGVYRTCFCQAGLFAGDETMVGFGANTLEQQMWAERTWVRVAVVSYGGVVAVCGVALGVRLWISYCVRAWLGV